MKAEEAIEIIERTASLYTAIDTAVFSERVREDLSLFRRQADAPRFERRPEGGVEYPESRPEFSISDKYRGNAEISVVFSAFISCFLDPIDFGIDALGSFREFAQGSKVERVALVSESRQEEDPEEMEIMDLDRLVQQRRELIQLAAEIGRGLFDNEFDVRDFVAGEESHEQF